MFKDTNIKNNFLESKRSNIQEELNNFYDQMEISPNHSFNNLDTQNFEYCTQENQMGFNGGKDENEIKVKNILAHYLEENDEEISKTNDHITESVNEHYYGIKKQAESISPSFSEQNKHTCKESPSSAFRSLHYDEEIANDFSSSEKYDFFDMGEQTVYKQKLSYSTQVEDFILNCTPNPFSFEAQRAVEKIFLNKRIEEMKKKKVLTQKLMDKYKSKKEKDIFQKQSSELFYDDIEGNEEEPNISPRKIFQKELTLDDQQVDDHNNVNTHSSYLSVFLPKINQTSISLVANEALSMTNNNLQKQQQINKQSEIRELSNEENQFRVSKTPCKCRKSLCLKLYCECFARGEMCGPACVCLECRNSKKYTEQRNEAIKLIESKNPTAFLLLNSQASTIFLNNQVLNNSGLKTEQAEMLVDIRKGCNCKKSKCKKKYCECYMTGKKCTKLCQCIDCSNNSSHSHDSSSQSQQSPIQQDDLLDSNSTQNYNQIIKYRSVLAKEQKNSFDIFNQQYQNIQADQSLLYMLKDSNKQYQQQNKSEYFHQESPQSKKRMQSQIFPKKTEILSNKDTIRHNKNNQQDNTTYSQFEIKNPTNCNLQLSSKENQMDLKATKKIIKVKKNNQVNYH